VFKRKVLYNALSRTLVLVMEVEMALGTSRPRNWGKESQAAALSILTKYERKPLAAMRRFSSRLNVAYSVHPAKRAPSDSLKKSSLWLTPSKDGLTLPFSDSCADLVNTRRGHWKARHPFSGRVLATGISLRDVIRATIQDV